jgi:preprotein translocase subunit SecF
MNIIHYRKLFFGISGALVLASIVMLFIPPALTPGIDFSGGTALTVEFDQQIPASQVEWVLDSIGYDEAVIQSTADNSFFLRVRELEEPIRDDAGVITTPGEQAAIEDALATIGAFEIGEAVMVSGIIGAENVRNAIIAVIVAAIVILFYVTWAFRHVPSPFRYGMAAIVALVHDVLIVLGIFSVLGKTIDLEVNAMFITGVLTVIGYSVNDTIVVFDRVRENVLRFPASTIGEVVNLSVRETIGRSLNTSVTLLLVILSLALFASTAIQPLLFVMAAGVVVGTYSSIFIASLTLVAWEAGEIGGFFSHIPLIGRRRPTA